MIIELSSMTYEEYLLWINIEDGLIRSIDPNTDLYEVLNKPKFFLLAMKHGLNYTVVEK